MAACSTLEARALAAVETLRSRSRARTSAAIAQADQARSAGLVSVSTTCIGVPVPVWMAENTISIDRKQCRITRLRKGLGVAAKQLHNQGPKNQQVWMQTLTYAGDNRDWKPEHISGYLHQLRRWHYAKTGTNKVRYAWVAELQQRGVIHYHLICWLPGGLTPPKPDTPWRHPKYGTQAPMWPHGMSNRLKATAPVAYLMKYASKIESKTVGSFPHGARIHGAGGLDPSGRCIRRWVLWPAYVQGNASVQDRFKPAPGGGYLNVETGEHLRPQFSPIGLGFSRFVRVRHDPCRIDACGPFSWYESPADTTPSQ